MLYNSFIGKVALSPSFDFTDQINRIQFSCYDGFSHSVLSKELTYFHPNGSWHIYAIPSAQSIKWWAEATSTLWSANSSALFCSERFFMEHHFLCL
jgi:hypothetical protein